MCLLKTERSMSLSSYIPLNKMKEKKAIFQQHLLHVGNIYTDEKESRLKIFRNYTFELHKRKNNTSSSLVRRKRGGRDGGKKKLRTRSTSLKLQSILIRSFAFHCGLTWMAKREEQVKTVLNAFYDYIWWPPRAYI